MIGSITLTSSGRSQNRDRCRKFQQKAMPEASDKSSGRDEAGMDRDEGNRRVVTTLTHRNAEG